VWAVFDFATMILTVVTVKHATANSNWQSRKIAVRKLLFSSISQSADGQQQIVSLTHPASASIIWALEAKI
jgi:hypothetical protein